MRAVALLPVLSGLLTGQLVRAADHLRAPMITAAPDPAKLLVRQNAQCPATFTPCADGHGCCPDGEACIATSGLLGCQGSCNGGDFCPDGGCCDIGNTCTQSGGHFYCATIDSGPVFSLPPISVGSVSVIPGGPLTPAPSSIVVSSAAGSSSAMVPSETPAPSSSSPAGSGSGGESSSEASPPPSPTGSSAPSAPTATPGSAVRVDIPMVSWLAVLLGAFL